MSVKEVKGVVYLTALFPGLGTSIPGLTSIESISLLPRDLIAFGIWVFSLL